VPVSLLVTVTSAPPSGAGALSSRTSVAADPAESVRGLTPAATSVAGPLTGAGVTVTLNPLLALP